MGSIPRECMNSKASNVQAPSQSPKVKEPSFTGAPFCPHRLRLSPQKFTNRRLHYSLTTNWKQSIPVRNKCRISQASVSTKQFQQSPVGPENVTRRAPLRIPPLSLATEMFSWQPFTNKPFRDWITHKEGEKTLGVRLFIHNCNKLNQFFWKEAALMKEAPLFPAVAVQPLTHAITIWH